jgi:hypothetical protein
VATNTLETKVTYLKNDTVKLEMSMDDYRTLLQGNIDLKSAVEMMGECHTIYLEDLGKLDTLEWRMARVLGFKRKRSPSTGGDGGYYFGNYVLSNHIHAEKD